MPRDDLAFQNDTGTLVDVPTGEDKDQQPTLDHLANASVQGLVATGPRRGCRVLRLGGTGEDAEAAIMGKRCADVAGFNVRANVHSF
ncbi:MAG TPA: hypothetical protein VJ860_04475 [Polyangia bacterium]|nr:hypothetical protein [Polyangia bacterium]